MLVFEFDSLTLDRYGQTQTQQRQAVQGFQEDLAADTQLELVLIPNGTFMMGTPRTEEGWHPTQSPQHQVTIAAFWMGRYPVTQKQWQAVASLPKINLPLTAQPSCFIGDDRPVEQISWLEAIEFCQRLSHHSGRQYRLPSEAEWEYACRAGTTTPFHFGETITTDVANYSGVNWEYQGKICSKGAYAQGPQGVDRRETVEVGSFAANAFGLYDLHGQVREWCQDSWHDSYENAPIDGTAWFSEDSTQRILRGGSWNSSPKICRSASRSKLDLDSRLYDVGLRIVCESV